MDDTIQMLSSPTFWIGTVVVGILVNLVSSFVFKQLESYQAHRSLVSRKKKISQIAAEIDRAEQLRRSPNIFYAEMMGYIVKIVGSGMTSAIGVSIGIYIRISSPNTGLTGVLPGILFLAGFMSFTVFRSWRGEALTTVSRFVKFEDFKTNAQKQIAELEARDRAGKT